MAVMRGEARPYDRHVDMDSSSFQDVTPSGPRNSVDVSEKHLHRLLLAGFFLVYSSTLKMETIYSSETLVDFRRTTRLMSQKTELSIGAPVRASDPTRSRESTIS
jgi:hypothetical protein